MANQEIPEVEPTEEDLSSSELAERILEEIQALTKEMDNTMLVKQVNMLINYHNFYVDNIAPKEREAILLALNYQVIPVSACAVFNIASYYSEDIYESAELAYNQLTNHQLHKDDNSFSSSRTTTTLGVANQMYGWDQRRYLEELQAKAEMIKNAVRLMNQDPSVVTSSFEQAVEQQQALINMAGDAYNGAISVSGYTGASKSSQLLGLVGTAAGAYIGSAVPIFGTKIGAMAGASLGNAVGSVLGGLF